MYLFCFILHRSPLIYLIIHISSTFFFSDQGNHTNHTTNPTKNI